MTAEHRKGRRRLLVANRGEIAVRIIRAAHELGLETTAVASEDEVDALHVRLADEVRVLRGRGPAPYAQVDQLLAAARDAEADSIHPGYGFLSERAELAEAVAAAGMTFVGPTPAQLELLGDKAAARGLAIKCDVPVLAGTPGPVSLVEATAFLARLDRPVMLKALAGGGGRGIRLVAQIDDLATAYARCSSEAERSFGDPRLFVEAALPRAKHVEVQVVGDGSGAVIDLGERDCTLQRRSQKLIEIAPSPCLSDTTRQALIAAAVRMASLIELRNLATFEFLVDLDEELDPPFVFLEANARLQVEHTITEELWGVDLVRTQLVLADGAPLHALHLEGPPAGGYAIQARVNLETLREDGTPTPTSGPLTAFDVPTGPGVRVDTFGYTGYLTTTAFDSLLAKVIVHTRSGSLAEATAKAARALAEFSVGGPQTNISFLRALLEHPSLGSPAVSTRFVDEHLAELLAMAAERDNASDTAPATPPPERPVPALDALADGALAVEAPVSGVVVAVAVAVGDTVAAGQELVVIEAMKMEQPITAPSGGIVHLVSTEPGQSVEAGQLVVAIVPGTAGGNVVATHVPLDLDHVRPDLAEVIERRQLTEDAARPEAVARRRERGARTARENVATLCDPGTFREYGRLAVAAQRRRRPMADLMARTPADGVIVGFGQVNGSTYGARRSHTCVIAFDETVLAGTMGEAGRDKLKHALDVAYKAGAPLVLFAEGGGGRAGDTDGKVGPTGWTMDVSAYYQFGRLSGLVPLVGITTGRCFAANAGVLATCDVIIATRHANIGVGGPTMVEGGRLGSFTPEEIGPMSVQVPNGVVDLLVDDETAAAEVAKRYLGYFQGDLPEWRSEDQGTLRSIVPENRLRSYDVRQVVGRLADTDTVLELRPMFGVGIITALARVEGRPIGIIANNPLHLGGAIDSAGADKASRFMQLCEAFDLPVLFLCDTPGVMVGPEAEREATVRKMGRMFVTGANLTVPFFTIILRKAYGIGAELMAGGWFKATRFTVSWPTGELGGMNIEGNVRLGHAAELASIDDPAARRARFEQLVAELYAVGRALEVATHYEIDDVIDPAESRSWIVGAIATHEPDRQRTRKRVPFVDPW